MGFSRLGGALCGLLARVDVVDEVVVERVVVVEVDVNGLAGRSAPVGLLIGLPPLLCKNQWLLCSSDESIGWCCWYHLWMPSLVWWAGRWPLPAPLPAASRGGAAAAAAADGEFTSECTESRFRDLVEDDDSDDDERLTTSELRRLTPPSPAPGDNEPLCNEWLSARCFVYVPVRVPVRAGISHIGESFYRMRRTN